MQACGTHFSIFYVIYTYDNFDRGIWLNAQGTTALKLTYKSKWSRCQNDHNDLEALDEHMLFTHGSRATWYTFRCMLWYNAITLL